MPLLFFAAARSLFTHPSPRAAPSRVWSACTKTSGKEPKSGSPAPRLLQDTGGCADLAPKPQPPTALPLMPQQRSPSYTTRAAWMWKSLPGIIHSIQMPDINFKQRFYLFYFIFSNFVALSQSVASPGCSKPPKEELLPRVAEQSSPWEVFGRQRLTK